MLQLERVVKSNAI